MLGEAFFNVFKNKYDLKCSDKIQLINGNLN